MAATNGDEYAGDLHDASSGDAVGDAPAWLLYICYGLYFDHPENLWRL